MRHKTLIRRKTNNAYSWYTSTCNAKKWN